MGTGHFFSIARDRVARIRIAIALVAMVATMMPLAAIPADASVQSGFKGPSYAGTGAENEGGAVTGEKPESKLWFQDGSWYASMVSSASAGAHTIHRLNGTSWTDTGTVIDSRATSKEDVLNTGSKLYVVSRSFSSSGGAQLRRFSYSSGNYTLDTGFPVAVPGSGAETLTLARDTTNTLWLTWTTGTNAQYAYSMGSDTTWSGAQTLLFTEATTLNTDDISGIVAFSDDAGPAVGIMFSNQNNNAQYFAVHRDGAAASTWTLETALSGPNESDDHINLKAGDGRVFAAVKTGASANAQPLIRLLDRSPAGSWSKHPVAQVSEQNTRPITMLELDLTTRQVYVFMAIGQGNAGRGISYKKSSIDGIGFPSQATILIEGANGEAISYPTTSKANATSASGIVVVASDGANYWHNKVLGGVSVSPPTANPLSTGTTTGTAADIRITAGDPENCELTFTIQSSPSHGSLGALTNEPCAAGSPNGDSALIRYTPTAGFSGTDSFTFRVNDGTYNSATATVTINVSSAGIFLRGSAFSDNGVANSVSTTLPGGIQSGDVMIGSVDVRGNTTITPPTGWSLIRMDANGSSHRKATYLKIATGSEGGTVTFGLSRTEAAVVGVLVYAGVDSANPVNAHSGNVNGSSSPQLVAPSITTTTNNARVIGLFGAAADATIAPPAGMVERGEAAANAGQYDVTGEGADRTQASAGATGSATATANTSVRSISQQIALKPGVAQPNQAPTANNDTANATAGVLVNINAAGNDTDPENSLNLASIVIVTQPTKGTASANSNGTINYTPGAAATGTDTIVYTIKDTLGAVSNQATITITINTTPNTPPTAVAGSSSTAAGTAVDIVIRGNDPETCELAFTVSSGPSGGSLGTITGAACTPGSPNTDSATVRYTPNAGYSGQDQFSFTVSDGTATSSPATVTIDVTPVGTGAIVLRGANYAPNGTGTTAAVTYPAGIQSNDVMVATIDVRGRPTITPPAGWTLVRLDQNGSNMRKATYVKVATGSETGTLTFGLSRVESAVTGILVYSGVDTSNPVQAHAGLVDGSGSTDLIAPSITTTTNNARVIGLFGASRTTSITPPVGMIERGEATENTGQYDITGEAADRTQQTAGATGTAKATAAGSTRSISHQIALKPGVSQPNQAPTATNDPVDATAGALVTIDAAGNDTDPENSLDLASIVVVNGPAQGTHTVNPDGTVDYTPDPAATGTDTIDYTIDDTLGATSNQATITITITANQAPTANDDPVNATAGGLVTINAAGNDTDPENSLDLASIVVVNGPAQGTHTVNPDGTIDYTPDPAATGTDTIDYTIDDTLGATSNQATITITIAEPPAEIAIRSWSAAANQTAPTLIIDSPAGVQAGDVLVATVDARGKADATAPAGWTLIRADANGNTQRKSTYVRIATGSEPAQHIFTLSRTESASGTILAYTGVDTSNPILTHGANIESGKSSAELIGPSITTAQDGVMVIVLTGAAANVAISPAPSTTEWVEITSIGNYDITTHAAGLLQQSADASGTFTAIATTTTKYISHTIGLRPLG